jgi:hypothetical protein
MRLKPAGIGLAANRRQYSDLEPDDRPRDSRVPVRGPEGWRLSPVYDVNAVSAEVKERARRHCLSRYGLVIADAFLASRK